MGSDPCCIRRIGYDAVGSRWRLTTHHEVIDDGMPFVSEFNGDCVRPTLLFSPKEHPMSCLMHRELVLGNAARDNHLTRTYGQAFVFPLYYSAWQVFVFALLLIYTLKLFFAVAPGVQGNQGGA